MTVIRTEGNLEEVETPQGRWWIPAGDGLALAVELAEQSQDVYENGERAVHPGDIVLDCGGNVGVFTRVSLRRGASRVVAIEPGPWAVECLRRNFAEEVRDGRVMIYPKGVWDHDDTLELNVPEGVASTDATVALNRKPGKRCRFQSTDPVTIPELARQLWPNYRLQCAVCTEMNEHLQPVVMYGAAN